MDGTCFESQPYGKNGPGFDPASEKTAELRSQQASQRIKNLHRQGRLGFRTVVTSTSSATEGYVRSTREADYIQGRLGYQPRPVTVPAYGKPTDVMDSSSHMCLALWMEDDQPLFIYKGDADTKWDMQPDDRASRFNKKLLPPNLVWLQQKQAELNRRMYSLYPEKTSGHYLPDGSFQPGKIPEREKEYFGRPFISHNEVVLSGYTRNQILGTVISDKVELLPVGQDDLPTWITSLEAKIQLEQSEGLLELPVIFYDSRRGMITDVLYLDELLPEGTSLDEHKEVMDDLRDYCLCNNLSVKNLSADLWRFGPAEALRRIMSVSGQLKAWKANKNDANVKMQALIESGSLDPEAYVALIQEGADLSASVLSKAGGQNQLLNMLLLNRRELRSIIGFKRYASRQQKGKFSSTKQVEMALSEHKVNLVKLARVLVQGGLLSPEMLVVYEQSHIDIMDMHLEFLSLGGVYFNENTFTSMLRYYHRSPEPDNPHACRIMIDAAVAQFSPRCLNQLLGSECKKVLKLLLSRRHSAQPIELEQVEPHFRLIKTLLRAGAQIESSELEAIRQEVPGLFKGAVELMNSEEARDNREKNELLHRMFPRKPLQSSTSEPSGEDILKCLFEVKPFKLDTSLLLDDMAQQVIEHYYRTIHLSQIIDRLKSRENFSSSEPRNHHGVDHVVRTMRIAQALIMLHIKHDKRYQDLFMLPELDVLLPMALIYHDAVAEVERKDMEEFRAAEMFKRDMVNAGFEIGVVELVASALRNKNVNTMDKVEYPYVSDKWASEIEMKLRYLIRQPDCIDITRVMSIPESFPDVQYDLGDEDFNSEILLSCVDPYLRDNPEFMEDFQELVRSSADLAAVTGGAALEDRRQGGDYSKRHGLIDLKLANPERKKMISKAPNACKAMDEAQDEIVRREVASQAGMVIQSDYELSQVPAPELTLLEKFQLKRPEVAGKLKLAAEKAKNMTLMHPVGSLTQELLASGPVREKLAERGIQAFQVERQRGPGTTFLWNCVPEQKIF